MAISQRTHRDMGGRRFGTFFTEHTILRHPSFFDTKIGETGMLCLTCYRLHTTGVIESEKGITAE